jgi:pyochelin biosynthesis protein PchC
VTVVPALPAASRLWLRRFTTVTQPWARLVCLPHAGGSASFFRPWRLHLAPDVELYAVQYPGRLDRIADPCLDDMDEVAGAICAALAPLMDRPVALFGHSLGATIGYEVARRLPARTGRAPVRLFVSGRPGPERLRRGTRHLWPDDALWATIGTLGGTRSEVLADAELQRAFLPALRSDYRLAERYRPAPGPRLGCPVTALIGDADTEVDAAEAGSWAQVTDAGFSLRSFPGDHFYLLPRQADVLAEVQRRLLESVGPRSVDWAGP